MVIVYCVLQTSSYIIRTSTTGSVFLENDSENEFHPELFLLVCSFGNDVQRVLLRKHPFVRFYFCSVREILWNNNWIRIPFLSGH